MTPLTSTMDDKPASTFENTVILPDVFERELANDDLLVVNLLGTNESNTTVHVRKNSLSFNPETQKEGNKSHRIKKQNTTTTRQEKPII